MGYRNEPAFFGIKRVVNYEESYFSCHELSVQGEDEA